MVALRNKYTERSVQSHVADPLKMRGLGESPPKAPIEKEAFVDPAIAVTMSRCPNNSDDAGCSTVYCMPRATDVLIKYDTKVAM